MSADEHVAEASALRRRYPRWTIWFGQATGHWFALPPLDRDIGDFVEATTVAKLISVIEVIQHAPILNEHPNSRRGVRSPSNLLRLEGVPQPPIRRVPVVAWPGGTAR